MKTGLLKTNALVLLTATVLFAVGCSNSNSSDTVTNTLPVINGQVPAPIIIDPSAPTTPGTTTPTFSTGSEVAFTPTSLAQMNKYVATHPLNNPSNFKISINLASVGSSRYGGQVSISYVDNNTLYKGDFNSGMGVNQSYSGMKDNGVLESNYNYWFTYNNQTVFTGFFEDQYGAITITLVPQTATTGGNDAEPVTSGPYKGYVYFKNFTTTFAQHSPYRACWFTYTGPYDCRSNVIQTKCGLFPGAEAGYELLGTFSGVDIKKAFNIN